MFTCCFFGRCRLKFKCDGTRWRMGGEVNGKLVNGVGSQYPSHYLGTWCIQHYYRWCAQLGRQYSTELTPTADLNGLARFAERRNLVSARVPSHFNWLLLAKIIQQLYVQIAFSLSTIWVVTYFCSHFTSKAYGIYCVTRWCGYGLHILFYSVFLLGSWNFCLKICSSNFAVFFMTYIIIRKSH